MDAVIGWLGRLFRALSKVGPEQLGSAAAEEATAELATRFGDALLARLEKVEAHHGSCLAQVDDLQRELAVMRERQRDTEAELERVRTQLEAANATLNRLRGELDALRARERI